MAITVAETPNAGTRHSRGDQFEATRTITLDNSYPTGGEVVTAAQFGLTRIQRAEPAIVTTPGATGIFVQPLVQNDGSLKIKATTNALVEVANGSDQSALVCIVTVYGY